MAILPLESSKPDSSLSKQVILVYGQAKIGKSTLCSKFEKPLFLATEPGLNNLDVFRVNVTNWEKFLTACSEIAEGKHGFKTIVIDTVDNLVIFCQDYICKKEGVSHPADLPHGKGWHMVTSELHRALAKLAILPYGLILVSHCELLEVETKTKKYNRFTISIGGKNRQVVLNMVDLILFIDSVSDSNGEKRIIRTKPSLYWEAGDRANRLPEIVPLDYDALAKYFK